MSAWYTSTWTSFWLSGGDDVEQELPDAGVIGQRPVRLARDREAIERGLGGQGVEPIQERRQRIDAGSLVDGGSLRGWRRAEAALAAGSSVAPLLRRAGSGTDAEAAVGLAQPAEPLGVGLGLPGLDPFRYARRMVASS